MASRRGNHRCLTTPSDPLFASLTPRNTEVIRTTEQAIAAGRESGALVHKAGRNTAPQSRRSPRRMAALQAGEAHAKSEKPSERRRGATGQAHESGRQRRRGSATRWREGLGMGSTNRLRYGGARGLLDINLRVGEAPPQPPPRHGNPRQSGVGSSGIQLEM